MQKHFSPFLALRYLKPKRNFVSVITLIAVMGVALGVMILVVVISIFSGYEKRLRETILAYEPHIVVSNQDDPSFWNWPEDAEKVRQVPDVISATPFVRGQVLMSFNSRIFAPTMQAIAPPPGPQLEKLEGMIDMGFNPESGEEDIPRGSFDFGADNAIIGDDLAMMMGIEVGDTIIIYKNMHQIGEALERLFRTDPEELEKELKDIKEMTAPYELLVVGIYDSGNPEFDSRDIFVPLIIGQELYNLGPGAHGLALQITNGLKAHEVTPRLKSVLPPNLTTLTWMDLHRQLFNAVAAERQGMYFILMLELGVSGFCIMTTMITSIYQKRSEIGIMKAIGAAEHQIVLLFLYQGIVIGIIGTVSGLVSAGLIIEFREAITDTIGQVFGIAIFESEVYQIDGGLPADPRLYDLVVISLGAFLACLVASLAPAIMAARLQPADALRSE